uniref:Uncharacterized protein n=2 Tax=Lotharella globosa TaxID=91324 RepID=A0A7S3YHE6_9EUKA
MYLWSRRANLGISWAQGVAGARWGNSSLARSCARELRKMAEEVRPHFGLFSSYIEAAALQVEGLRAYLSDGDSSGVEMIEKAVRMEAELGKVPYGPPVVSPASELLGEIYLKDNKPGEAEKVVISAVDNGTSGLKRTNALLLVLEAKTAQLRLVERLNSVGRAHHHHDGHDDNYKEACDLMKQVRAQLAEADEECSWMARIRIVQQALTSHCSW